MSLPGSNNLSDSAPKPRADLYTVLLVVALLALIIGTAFLWAETRDYGSPPYQGAPSAWVAPQAPASLLAASPASSEVGASVYG